MVPYYIAECQCKDSLATKKGPSAGVMSALTFQISSAFSATIFITERINWWMTQPENPQFKYLKNALLVAQLLPIMATILSKDLF